MVVFQQLMILEVYSNLCFFHAVILVEWYNRKAFTYLKEKHLKHIGLSNSTPGWYMYLHIFGQTGPWFESQQVKVTPWSSFEQTIMSRSPRCYIPSVMDIGPPVQEKKIFEGFYHIWAWRQSWSFDSIMSSKFHVLVLESFHTKFGSEQHSSF